MILVKHGGPYSTSGGAVLPISRRLKELAVFYALSSIPSYHISL